MSLKVQWFGSGLPKWIHDCARAQTTVGAINPKHMELGGSHLAVALARRRLRSRSRSGSRSKKYDSLWTLHLMIC
eukprot:3619302-Amphidinium_carterae.1